MIDKTSKSVSVLIAGAAGISFSPVFVKLMGNANMGASAIGFWRTLLGFLVLFFIMKLLKKPVFPSKPVTFWAALTGFFFFLDLMFWHKSIIFVGSGMATVLGNTQVFFTALWGYLFFKEKLNTTFFIFATAGLTGVLLLTGIFSEKIELTGNYLTGIILGLFTGVCYSLYLIGLKKSQSEKSSPEAILVITWICFFSSIFLGLASIFEEGDFIPTNLTSLLSLLGLGIFVQALAWWFIGNAIKEVQMRTTSLILLLQPVLAMIWGYIFFAEFLESVQIIGAVITLSAIYFGSIYKDTKTVNKSQLSTNPKRDIT